VSYWVEHPGRPELDIVYALDGVLKAVKPTTTR